MALRMVVLQLTGCADVRNMVTTLIARWILTPGIALFIPALPACFRDYIPEKASSSMICACWEAHIKKPLADLQAHN
jgi:hypothetical protein